MRCLLSSSFACSPALIAPLDRQTPLEFLRQLLHLDPGVDRPELGILYTSGFRGNISSGQCSDGSAWGFDVAGKPSLRCRGETISLFKKDVEYEIRRFCLSVDSFHLIRRYRTLGDKIIHSRIDLCLPREHCARFSRLYQSSTSETYQSEALIEELLESMYCTSLLASATYGSANGADWVQ